MKIASWGNFKGYPEYKTNEPEIADLLVGRKIVNTIRYERDENMGTLVLDDGTQLIVEANSGCGGCSSGWFLIDQLAGVDNIITSVRFAETENEGDMFGDRYGDRYSIFVIADGVPDETEVLRVVGDYGNGWYGGGYQLYVRKASE